jgi:DNA-binding protein
MSDRRELWAEQVKERPAIEARIAAINAEVDAIEPARVEFLQELATSEQKLRTERGELESKLRFIAQLEVRLQPAQ